MNQQLLRLSEMAINGQILHKLDLIGSVTIENRPYFTVYRRYNNVHEMVVVDYHGDIYLQKDLSFSESLCRVLCISKEKMEQAQIQSLLSFKHHGEPPSGYYGLFEKTWSEIHESWFGIAVSLNGLFDSSSSSSSDSPPSSDSFPSSDQSSTSDVISAVSPLDSTRDKVDIKYEPTPIREKEEQWIHFLIELKHPSSSNPICDGSQKDGIPKKECVIVKKQQEQQEQQDQERELKEEKKRTSSSLSPPSSPRLTALAHQMILRNGRELRRKIS